MKTKFASVFCTLIACTSLVHAAEQKVYTVATDATFPPFEYTTANGGVAGYDIDLMHALCDQAEIKCNVIAAAWSGMFPGLLGKKYDALISSLNVTEERKRVMAFSDVYERPVYQFVAARDKHVDINPAGLKGKTIGVEIGTPMDAFVTQKFGDVATVKRYDSGSEPYLDLASGRIDALFSYRAQIQSSFLDKDGNATHYVLVGPGYTGADSPVLGEGVAIALRKQDDVLRSKLNQALAALRANGSLKKINDKWFGANSTVTQ